MSSASELVITNCVYRMTDARRCVSMTENLISNVFLLWQLRSQDSVGLFCLRSVEPSLGETNDICAAEYQNYFQRSLPPQHLARCRSTTAQVLLRQVENRSERAASGPPQLTWQKVVRDSTRRQNAMTGDGTAAVARHHRCRSRPTQRSSDMSSFPICFFLLPLHAIGSNRKYL